MPTYFAGSTLDAFVPSLTNCTDDASVVYVSPGGFADAYVTDPADGIRKGVSRLWSHAHSVSGAFAAAPVLYSWFNQSGVEVVRFASVAGGYQLQYFNAGSWVGVGEPMGGGSGTYDFLIYIHPTAGRLAWFFNQNLAVDVRALDTSPIGNVARMRLGILQGYVGNTAHSGVLLASYNTIGHTVRRRAPTANGTRMTWSGSYADVDDAATDDSDAISASNVGDVATFTGPVFTPTSAGNVIKAVGVAARIRNDGDVIPTNAKVLLSVGGEDQLAPTNMPITAGFQGSVAMFDKDPGTGLPWSDISRVNGEFGLVATE
ncbi:hypothetical protein [Sphingomonas asaccharolytica]|uniref:hypothetical protein n=1 Tax=Sphingomonas asaccharolytica TaxID=40681 RepID=UPI00082ECBAA|nr:hypothetical protein [Sphingomonas asaccharolytica]